MLADGDVANNGLADLERQNLIARHLASPKLPIEELTYQESDFVSLGEKTAELLSAMVVSETIKSLRDDAEISEWVHLGLSLHKKKKAEECLFCEQSLPIERISALERHFNDAYERLTKSLAETTKTINGISERLSELEIPHGTQFYEDLADEYETHRVTVQTRARWGLERMDCRAW